MPRGKTLIPELQVTTLTRFIEKFKEPPNLMLSAMFPGSDYPSNTIKWESQEGTRELAKFKAPGAPTHTSAPLGIAQHSAEAAFWGDKMYFDEEFLNNLRKEGTENTYLAAKQRLARETAGMVNRANRRREWMFSKMIFENGFSYSEQSGHKINVDYGIPTENIVTLTGNDRWNVSTSTSITVMDDIMDAKEIVSDACGVIPKKAYFNTSMLKTLASDAGIRSLLQKSMFGDGDLFSKSKGIVSVNTAVIGKLLDIDELVVYDELYEVRAGLTANTATNSAVINVDDITDFEVGGVVTLVKLLPGSRLKVNHTIDSINVEASTVTFTANVASRVYRAGIDLVVMKKKYIPDNTFTLIASSVEGRSIAEYMRAPYGNTRTWGMKVDTKENWDPEGLFVRVQDKGMPVLYYPEAIFQYKMGAS